MFNFIRGMFNKSATTSDMTWNVPVFNYEYEGRKRGKKRALNCDD